MARGRGKAAQALEALLDSGDHRAARAFALERLAGGAPDPEAQAVLASLAPEPGALLAGALGAVAAVALAAWIILAG